MDKLAYRVHCIIKYKKMKYVDVNLKFYRELIYYSISKNTIDFVIIKAKQQNRFNKMPQTAVEQQS